MLINVSMSSSLITYHTDTIQTKLLGQNGFNSCYFDVVSHSVRKNVCFVLVMIALKKNVSKLQKQSVHFALFN